MNNFRSRRAMLATFIVAAVLAASVHAADPLILPPAPKVAASGYLLIDADSQKVLAENNSQEMLPPASLTKIMTSYVAASELASGRISLTDQVPISVKAWRTPGSRMFVKEGTTVSLENLLKGMAIQSGNDASVAIAEHIAGSEEAFAEMMNRQAQQLGMNDTQFINATGLPADGHYTTAWDLSLLTRDLIKRFPEHYAMYSEKSFRACRTSTRSLIPNAASGVSRWNRRSPRRAARKFVTSADSSPSAFVLWVSACNRNAAQSCAMVGASAGTRPDCRADSQVRPKQPRVPQPVFHKPSGQTVARQPDGKRRWAILGSNQ